MCFCELFCQIIVLKIFLFFIVFPLLMSFPPTWKKTREPEKSEDYLKNIYLFILYPLLAAYILPEVICLLWDFIIKKHYTPSE